MRPDEYSVALPHEWAPRHYQRKLWDYLENGGKRAVAVWHRRAGKDVTAFNFTLTQTILEPGIYWHIAPTKVQGRKIMWEGKTREGRDFLSFCPEELISRKRDDEMALWIQSLGEKSSLWQVVGTDDPDSLVGPNPRGIIFTEYSLANPAAWNLLRPILVENDGWVLFIYTPRGRNHGYAMYKRAQKLMNEGKDWFCELLTVDDTGIVSEADIQAERDAGMPEVMIQQEFYCSWDAPLEGAYYGPQMMHMQEQGRITRVPWEPLKPVITAWDLGKGDAMAIWFIQEIGPAEIRLIDYEQMFGGEGLPDVHKMMREKPYAYEEHLVPHDAKVVELGPGKSRIQQMREMGFGRIRIVPKIANLNDGIEPTRALLSRCYADQDQCEMGLQALREYCKQKIEGVVGPEGEPLYRDTPEQNWACHGADALRTYAQARGHRRRRDGKDREGPLAPDLAIV